MVTILAVQLLLSVFELYQCRLHIFASLASSDSFRIILKIEVLSELVSEGSSVLLVFTGHEQTP